jgi:hypothetical protein
MIQTQRALLVAVALLASLGLRAPAADAPPSAPHINKLPAAKVLFLGNSITFHPPLASIGWSGSWGMAASAEEKDYVHLVTAQVAKATGAKPQVLVKNLADFERGYDKYDLAAELKKELEFEADIVVIAIGENVPGLTTNEAKAGYAAAYARLLAELQKHGRPAIFARSSFWADPVKDEIMKKAAAEAHATFVDIGALGRDEGNFARSERKIEHAGVAAHPGDTGMAAIADAIWAAIEKDSKSAHP